MKQLKWYFKHGTKSETYSVLYEDETFMLVQNENSGKLSFGTKDCFGTLYGFPVNWSCLAREAAVDSLNRLFFAVNANPRRVLDFIFHPHLPLEKNKFCSFRARK